MRLFKKLAGSLGTGRKRRDEKRYPFLRRCQSIWKNYVPECGRSSSLQGELLRETEALRYEAQNNGNFNWDEDFSYFCDFIKEALNAQDALPQGMRQEVSAATGHIKACGEYGRKFNDGMIPDEELDVDMIACVDDEPYDVIDNAIGLLDSSVGGEPIPYEPNPSILR